MVRSLNLLFFSFSGGGVSGIPLVDSTNRNVSSTVRAVGSIFSTFGEETVLAGLEEILSSFTRYLKKDRRVEIFLAIELFLFLRWRKLKYFRIANRSTFSIRTSPLEERDAPEFFKNCSNSSRSLR